MRIALVLPSPPNVPTLKDNHAGSPALTLRERLEQGQKIVIFRYMDLRDVPASKTKIKKHIVRQSFQNNLFGFGAAASVLLTLVMFVWVAVWWRTFRRDLEVAA